MPLCTREQGRELVNNPVSTGVRARPRRCIQRKNVVQCELRAVHEQPQHCVGEVAVLLNERVAP